MAARSRSLAIATADVPLLLNLYRRGELLLDELVSKHYQLEEINDGYADLAAGRNARGVIGY